MSVYVVWMDDKELCFICDNAEIKDNMIIIYFSNEKCQYIPIVNIRQFSTSVKIHERRTNDNSKVDLS